MHSPASRRAAGSRGPRRALLLLVPAALSACAAAGGGTTLPWTYGAALGAPADVESTLAAVEVEWATAGAGERAALASAGEEAARRRGYRVGEEQASSRWRVTCRAGGGPAAAGDAPLAADGYPAALADRVRRASARAVPPTRATVELALLKFGAPVWTGTARYDPDPEQPAGGAAAALRLLAAQLPRFDAGPAPARRVAADSVVSFYRDALEGRTFACPAAPYPVRFPDLQRAYLRGGRAPGWEDMINAQSHDDATLLPSVLDLVLWADIALPRSIPGYRDPAGADLWREVTLFADLADADGTVVPLEVTLEGDTRGYEVRESRVLDAAAARARRAELLRFAGDLEQWIRRSGR